jgi:hypothetical protein
VSTIAGLDEAIGGGLVPDDPADLNATMEGLPGFWGTMAAKLDELAVWAGGTIGEETSQHLTEMAQTAGRASAIATEAFTSYQRESAGWR